MKKLLSFLVSAIMVASLAALAVNGAGAILMRDDFSGDELNADNWIVDGNLFYVEDGYLCGQADAVANQTEFRREVDGNKAWRSLTSKMDVFVPEFDVEGDHSLGYWWRDYDTTYDESDDGAEENGFIYRYYFNFETQTFTFFCDDSESPLHRDNTPLTYTLPEGTIISGDDGVPTNFSMGIRVITADVASPEIQCFYNDQLIIKATVAEGLEEDMGLKRESPIVLFNHGNDIRIDNFVVATYDYNLFNESEEAPVDDNNNPTPTPVDPGDPVNPGNPVNPTPNPQNPGNSGTNPGNADTTKNPTSSSGGANTGDMAAVVVALAVVSLGAAVVVKRK